jgi:DNA-binding response OmpR family regulator
MDTCQRVTLIDDDPAWLDALSELLRRRGFDIQTALGARRGLELLAKGDTALALVDYRMPDMNGLELLRRSRQRGQNVGFLLVSSEDDPMLKSRALAEGAMDFLAKSAAPVLLPHLLKQFLASLTASQERWLPVPRAMGPWLPVRLTVRIFTPPARD